MGRVIRIIKRYIASEVWPVHVRSVRDMFVHVRLVHVAIAVVCGVCVPNEMMWLKSCVLDWR